MIIKDLIRERIIIDGKSLMIENGEPKEDLVFESFETDKKILKKIKKAWKIQIQIFYEY